MQISNSQSNKMKLIVILATALCVTLVGSSPLSDRDRLQSEVSRLKNVRVFTKWRRRLGFHLAMYDNSTNMSAIRFHRGHRTTLVLSSWTFQYQSCIPSKRRKLPNYIDSSLFAIGKRIKFCSLIFIWFTSSSCIVFCIYRIFIFRVFNAEKYFR